jgi:hypothetical protein
MKKSLCLSMLILIFAGTSSATTTGRFSIGGFAGLNFPISQEDVGNGTLFGAKGRIMLLPFMGVEPNFVFSEYGEKDHDINGATMTRKGGSLTSFGADALIGTFSGFSQVRFYGLLGINSNTLKRDGIPDQTRLGLSWGAGIEFLASNMFGLELRARLHSISLDGGGGRNNLQLSAGLNYYFGPD